MMRVCLICIFGMISSCKAGNSFMVPIVTFSDGLIKALNLYVEELGDKIDSNQNVLFVNVQEMDGGVVLVLHNNMIAKENFENCARQYDYVSYFKGYKVYVVNPADKFISITDEESEEIIPVDCDEYIPVTYDGATWEILIKNDTVERFDVRFMSLSSKVRKKVIAISGWL